jgi:hypothetical protein
MKIDLAIAAFLLTCWAIVFVGLEFSAVHALVLTGLIILSLAAGALFFLNRKGEKP